MAELSIKHKAIYTSVSMVLFVLLVLQLHLWVEQSIIVMEMLYQLTNIPEYCFTTTLLVKEAHSIYNFQGSYKLAAIHMLSLAITPPRNLVEQSMLMIRPAYLDSKAHL